MATIPGLAAELQATQQRLALAEGHAVRLAESLESYKAEVAQLLANADGQIRDLRNQRTSQEEKVNLVDLKTMDPGCFGGTEKESWRQWSEKVKAYCN